MTRPEMLYGNLLIGKFMDDGISRQIKEKNVLPLSTAEIFVETRNYHKDWNKLMLVVQKIKELTAFKSIDECTDEEWRVTTNLTRLPITSTHGAVYQRVTEFIKWYNANK